MRWFWLFFLSLAIGFTSPAAAQIKDEVSDITGDRRVMSKKLSDIAIQTYPGNDAGMMAKYEADPETGEESWSLAFYGFADATTSMTAVDQLTILAGGQQVQALQVETKTRQLDDGTVVEIKEATFTRGIFETIANASSMTITIGTARFTANKRARKDMRLILDQVPPADARPTASNGNESGG